MNAEVNALVTTSQSWTGHSLDVRRRALAYLLLQKIHSANTGVNIPYLKQVSSGYQGWNDDLQLNAMLFALGQSFNLNLDARGILTAVASQWSVPAGIVDADEVKNLIYYGNLALVGANVTVNASPQ